MCIDEVNQLAEEYPSKCGDCSRRRFYQMGYEDGKNFYNKNKSK
jgi:hypothetical protein